MLEEQKQKKAQQKKKKELAKEKNVDESEIKDDDIVIDEKDLEAVSEVMSDIGSIKISDTLSIMSKTTIDVSEDDDISSVSDVSSVLSSDSSEALWK